MNERTMQVEFWGVRGSVPVPGESTRVYGGNTSCVEVRCGERTFVLDAGTGIRPLGQRLTRGEARPVTLLLSHLHWDHIQGLPFFAPLYTPGRQVEIVGGTWGERSLEGTLATQMCPPTFPVRWEELPSCVTSREVRDGACLRFDDVSIRCAKLSHPGGGVMAYRIEYAGRSVVYATDTEHYSCVDPSLKRLAEGADLLIYDSQYTPEEYRGERGPAKTGWGHSTYEAGAALAGAAGVGHYALFHHDPARTDDEVRKLEERAQALFARTTAAREGLIFDVTEREEAA